MNPAAPSPRRVTILGATGSVGRQALDLIERQPAAFQVVALTAERQVAALAEAARRTGAELAVIGDEALLPELRDRLAGCATRAAAGRGALIDAAGGETDWVMAAIVGCAGLEPAMAAIRAGRVVALANKEALVTAGALMIDAAQRHGATILPVDSEHNAIFQCLGSGGLDHVSRLILTASGGPFRTMEEARMRLATPEEAVAHPNWSMGSKISVDSATMMNKGLELIEAHHLFGIEAERIDILLHPQSVVHSLVEYSDGSVLAQLGAADMRIPIAHTLAWPGRMASPAQRLDLAAIGRLDFEPPDERRFPSLRIARQALGRGGSAPIALNAANEVAVAAFLAGRIGFLDIASLVERALERTTADAPASVAEVIAIDGESRRIATALMIERAA